MINGKMKIYSESTINHCHLNKTSKNTPYNTNKIWNQANMNKCLKD